MSDLRELFNSKVVAPNIETSIYTKSYGIVIRANEKNNCCDIKYFDAKGRPCNRNNVFVKTNSENKWFPLPGMMVELEIFEDQICIIDEIVTDYSKQVKPRKMAMQDIYVDGADSSVGCYIF